MRPSQGEENEEVRDCNKGNQLKTVAAWNLFRKRRRRGSETNTRRCAELDGKKDSLQIFINLFIYLRHENRKLMTTFTMCTEESRCRCSPFIPRLSAAIKIGKNYLFGHLEGARARSVRPAWRLINYSWWRVLPPKRSIFPTQLEMYETKD